MPTIGRRLIAAVLVTAALFCLQALWIPAKATLGQWLMQRAWNQALAGNPPARPWPWADTRPLALLEVPRLGVRQFVLEGASARNLAWGPAVLTGIKDGDVILSGHRDTHFKWVSQVRPGDRLVLTTLSGVRTYVYDHAEVVDARQLSLVQDVRQRRMSLVTCFPFDTATSGGPLRYVATAREVSA